MARKLPDPIPDLPADFPGGKFPSGITVSHELRSDKFMREVLQQLDANTSNTWECVARAESVLHIDTTSCELKVAFI